jgi:hypothetical protein
MMSLKLRRNLPLVLLLLTILTFLALGLGDQRIVAYTAATDSQQAEAAVTLDSDGITAGLPETPAADAGVAGQSMIRVE